MIAVAASAHRCKRRVGVKADDQVLHCKAPGGVVLQIEVDLGVCEAPRCALAQSWERTKEKRMTVNGVREVRDRLRLGGSSS